MPAFWSIFANVQSRMLRPSQLVLMVTYAVGVVGLTIPATQPLFRWMTASHLLLTLGLLSLQHPAGAAGNWRWTVPVALLIGTLGWGIEAVGVATGLVFGQYDYGTPFGYQFLHTPLLIGANWVLLSYCATDVVLRKLPRWLAPLGAAVLMVAVDYLLEPVAIQLDFWHWYQETVPLQNYVVWFGTSLLFTACWAAMLPNQRNPIAPLVLGLQALFFMLLLATFFIWQ